MSTHVVVRQSTFVQFEDRKRPRSCYVSPFIIGIEKQVVNHVLYKTAVEHESQGLVTVKVCQQCARVVANRIKEACLVVCSEHLVLRDDTK